MLSCSVIGGSAWGLASTFSAMHEASRTLAEGTTLRIAMADAHLPPSVPSAVKSSRFLRESEGEVRGRALDGEAVVLAQQRIATRLALAEKRDQAESKTILTAFARAERPARQQATTVGNPSLLTALVEDVPVQEIQPFGLVLAEPEQDEDLALPDQIPLPEARPAIATVAPEQKPAEEKPVERGALEGKGPVAPVQPERSFFGNLFNRKAGGGAWRGNDTKVAIYDVSAATVYLPDGTKLRAHSGIGSMRDNPRYEHVTMKGPTPAGVYRLSMREKRFYGVEAIRMTSIDGRDPKNRTGLLTHTNLLRGQIGSHGCVAFQDYQPFLKAFKRGQIRTLVVVPTLPSATQLAALYRKAGA